MEMSSATYASIDPTNLDNFNNPLHLAGEEGLMGVLDSSDAPVRFTALRVSVDVVPGKRSELWAYGAEREGKIYVNQITQEACQNGFLRCRNRTWVGRPPDP
jgi:hypothetical protein